MPEHKKKLQILFLTVTTVVGGIFGFALIQNKIINVSAQIEPISFIGPNASFGIVFPGENLEKEFYVSASSEYPNPITYQLTFQPKPRPEFSDEIGSGAASDHCFENPDDFENCYPLLCPYLDIISEESEGDTKDYATLKEDQDDETDYWKVLLNAPPVNGYVGQDFDGIPLNEGGEYGCDIKLVLLETVGPELPNRTAGPLVFGGFGPLLGPSIYEQKIEEIGDTYVIISWFTDYPSSSRVIYDTISHSSLDFPPNYGYNFSTQELDIGPKVITHRIRIDGLKSQTSYFYRVVSRGSPERTSGEFSFATKKTSPEALETTPPKELSPEISDISESTSLPQYETGQKSSAKFLAQGDEKTAKELEKKEAEEGINGIKEETAGISTEKESSVSVNESSEKFDGRGLLAALGKLTLGWKFILILLTLIILALVFLWLVEKRKKEKHKDSSI